ncbi:hypothetical protein ZHAS_00014741 [Anopheles sinensis]|uniref:Uncharacterized protein n=1 Tax=Anopheles sinensis TaxID=74873 RepID=A0A084W944_ANOSI|nr:hypothetical protein ZHAS_00014741 [Anopheles sinensis]
MNSSTMSIQQPELHPMARDDSPAGETERKPIFIKIQISLPWQRAYEKELFGAREGFVSGRAAFQPI